MDREKKTLRGEGVTGQGKKLRKEVINHASGDFKKLAGKKREWQKSVRAELFGEGCFLGGNVEKQRRTNTRENRKEGRRTGQSNFLEAS